jgi:Winged helix-turn-helix DNA-binding
MGREELLMVRALIDAFLALPEDLRAEVSRLLTLEAAKPGNGLDHHPPPPPAANSSSQKEQPLRRAPTPYVSERRRARLQASSKAAERKLLAAMRDNPGLSVIALANAAGSSRSATGERLRQMAARGVVTKDITGKWKVKEEEPALRPAGEDPGPFQPSPS